MAKRAPKKEPVSWTDPGGCGHCVHCAMDMDMEPFCAHPRIAKANPFGLLINHALKQCKRAWFETREPKGPRKRTKTRRGKP